MSALGTAARRGDIWRVVPGGHRWKDVDRARALSEGVPGGRGLTWSGWPRNREPGVRIRDVAADFGISESCLQNWLTRADRDDGIGPGLTTGEVADRRDAKKRIRLLEQDNEVLRRAAGYLSQANLPGK